MMGDEHLWTIVLAAGDGERVSALTSSSTGEAVPKQYCSFGRRKPMLRWALERARFLVPAERIVTVVAERHRAFWETELSGVERDNVIVQPRNRGTAAGILLPFLEIFLRRDREARILILPSDHFVADEAVLVRTLRRAVDLPRPQERLLLLGMTPAEFDPDYGWIMPSPGPVGSVCEVSCFVEKPSRMIASALYELGGLLNTFMLVADGSALLKVYRQMMPSLLQSFLRLVHGNGGGEALHELYETLPVSDFSRALQERAPSHLSVLGVPECGWADLGTPARIERFLRRHGRSSVQPRAARTRSAPRADALERTSEWNRERGLKRTYHEERTR